MSHAVQQHIAQKWNRLSLVMGGGAVLLWALVTMSAFGYFWRIDATPGAAATPPGRIESPGSRPRVLLFLHPECPCSRATVVEFNRALAQVRRPLDLTIYFVTSEATDQSWRETSLYQQALRVPGANVVADSLGVLAETYGVETSGQVVVYSSEGELVFAGGVTGSRGHEGDNAGKSGFIDALSATTDHAIGAPVYGCSLSSSTERASLKVLP